MPGTFTWKNFQALEMNIRTQAIKSDKERHHLSQNTAQDTNEKLNQLVNSDKNRYRYKDKEEHEDSRHQQKQGRRQPLESSEN